MIDVIRLGDTTDHGGEVVTASQWMKFRGVPVARIGDQIKCHQHPDTCPNVITEGDQKFKDHGVPVARHAYIGWATFDTKSQEPKANSGDAA